MSPEHEFVTVNDCRTATMEMNKFTNKKLGFGFALLVTIFLAIWGIYAASYSDTFNSVSTNAITIHQNSRDIERLDTERLIMDQTIRSIDSRLTGIEADISYIRGQLGAMP